jgi:(p)ppGpp synthase/HD superfamily hydrolase
MPLTTRYEEALLYALDKHRDQVRKGTGARVPYATHLLSVSALVGEYGGDEEQMMAALLHDVIEDQGVAAEELSARFGPRVAAIVVDCTDTIGFAKDDWEARKAHYVTALAHHGPDSKLVTACDKLHNASTIERDRARPEIGAAIWTRFRRPRDKTLAYYRALVTALAAGWDHPVVAELERVVARLELGP